MLTTPTIKIFYEVGKHVALKARGVSALILATGVGASIVALSVKTAHYPGIPQKQLPYQQVYQQVRQDHPDHGSCRMEH